MQAIENKTNAVFSNSHTGNIVCVGDRTTMNQEIKTCNLKVELPFFLANSEN